MSAANTRRTWEQVRLASRAGVASEPPIAARSTVASRPVLYGYRWPRLGPDQARWEQALTEDGRTWTASWILTFTRR